MVKHASDPRKPRGVVSICHPDGSVMVQWGSGEVIKYLPSQADELIQLNWNIYVR